VLVLAGGVGLTGCADAGSSTPLRMPAPTASRSTPPPEPVLAAPIGRTSTGLGTVRPRTISSGGDPATAIDSVTWSSWGGPTARGRGVGCFVPAGKPIASCVRRPVDVIATNLGRCDGRRAYEDLGWWFPTEGQTFDPKADFFLRGCAYPPTT
jgi:hypothetical protein